MTERQARLWQTLADYPLGAADATANGHEPPVVTFEDKLLRQTGWTRAYARRAIEEYRRYLLLAATAGHPVSPSPAVDEAWHLHLLYSRDYWQHLCPKVLGFDFHHEPATGTGQDRAKLDEGYARTLASYAETFGQPAPADVWPAKPSATRTLRADPLHSVVLPRATWRATLLALIVAATVAAACLVWIAWHLKEATS